MRIRFLVAIYIFILPLFAFSQQIAGSSYFLRGLVTDSLENEAVEMAAIALYAAKDSAFVKGSATDENGMFTISNINPASYFLTVSFLGYNTRYVNISEKRFSDKKIDLGTLKLSTSDIALSTVTVTAEVPELVVKEDTLEYNAAAFRLTESAVVEDLIKRLPGMEVDTEGKISTSAGKEVKRVFVDGKEFFGTDPTMATKNLNADMVEKVQVVEKKSDLAILTGVEDDDPETIINITIKKGMKQGWMGNASGGMGGLIDNVNNESARYQTNVNINRFTEEKQISFVTNANNINNRTSSDRGNNVRTSRGQGGSGNGITSYNTFGVNLSSIINNKLKYGGSITYNYSDNYSNSTSMRETFYNDVETIGTFRRNASRSKNYSNNFTFDGKVEYTPDSMTTMVFTPSFSYNKSSNRSASEQATWNNDDDATPINSSNSSNTLHSDGIQARMQVDVSRKLSTTGRKLSFSGWFNVNNSSGDGYTKSTTIFHQNNDRNSYRNQQSFTDGNRYAYNLRVAYVEPLGKGNFLNFSYNIQVNETVNKRKTYDYDSLTYTYTIYNDIYSKSSETNSTTHNIRANFNSQKTRYSYNVGINLSPVHNNSKTYIEDWFGTGRDSIVYNPKGRSAVNYSPFIDFTYRFNNSDRTIRRNLRMRYNGQTRQPSISQLDPTEDVTNPLNIRSGNPDLLPTFNNNINLEFNTNHRESLKSLRAYVAYVFIRNQIINFTDYDVETGVQTTRPINESGSWNMNTDVLASIPLDKKKKLRLTTRSNMRYQNNIGYSMVNRQSEKNISKTLTLTKNLDISYKNDRYYGQIRGQIIFSNTNYSLENIDNKNSTNFSITYNTQITLPLSFTVASDIKYTGNRGLSSGYNKNEVLWNAEINKQFLKRNQGSLRLQVTDILQQRLSIRRTTGDNYFQDTEYTSLSSYIIISFAYRFNNVGGNRGSSRSRSAAGEGGGGNRRTDRGGMRNSDTEF